MGLKVRNGGLLVGGNLGGLAQDCGCCDRPSSCADCCTGNIDPDGLANITLFMSLPSFRYDVYRYNGIGGETLVGTAEIPGVTIGGTYNLGFAVSSSGCVNFRWSGEIYGTDGAFSQFTFRVPGQCPGYTCNGEQILGLLAINFYSETDRRCAIRIEADFTVNVRYPTAGLNTLAAITQVYDEIAFNPRASGFYANYPHRVTGETEFFSRGPCAGVPVPISLTSELVDTGSFVSGGPRFRNLQYPTGTIGTLTVNEFL